jgi:hypothetical protein
MKTEVRLSAESRSGILHLHRYLSREIRRADRKQKRAAATARMLENLVARIPAPYHRPKETEPSDPLDVYFDLIRQRWDEALRTVGTEEAKAEDKISRLGMLKFELARIERDIYYSLNPDDVPAGEQVK